MFQGIDVKVQMLPHQPRMPSIGFTYQHDGLPTIEAVHHFADPSTNTDIRSYPVQLFQHRQTVTPMHMNNQFITPQVQLHPNYPNIHPDFMRQNYPVQTESSLFGHYRFPMQGKEGMRFAMPQSPYMNQLRHYPPHSFMENVKSPPSHHQAIQQLSPTSPTIPFQQQQQQQCNTQTISQPVRPYTQTLLKRHVRQKEEKRCRDFLKTFDNSSPSKEDISTTNDNNNNETTCKSIDVESNQEMLVKEPQPKKAKLNEDLTSNVTETSTSSLLLAKMHQQTKEFNVPVSSSKLIASSSISVEEDNQQIIEGQNQQVIEKGFNLPVSPAPLSNPSLLLTEENQQMIDEEINVPAPSLLLSDITNLFDMVPESPPPPKNDVIESINQVSVEQDSLKISNNETPVEQQLNDGQPLDDGQNNDQLVDRVIMETEKVVDIKKQDKVSGPRFKNTPLRTVKRYSKISAFKNRVANLKEQAKNVNDDVTKCADQLKTSSLCNNAKTGVDNGYAIAASNCLSDIAKVTTLNKSESRVSNTTKDGTTPATKIVSNISDIVKETPNKMMSTIKRTSDDDKRDSTNSSTSSKKVPWDQDLRRQAMQKPVDPMQQLRDASHRLDKMKSKAKKRKQNKPKKTKSFAMHNTESTYTPNKTFKVKQEPSSPPIAMTVEQKGTPKIDRKNLDLSKIFRFDTHSLSSRQSHNAINRQSFSPTEQNSNSSHNYPHPIKSNVTKELKQFEGQSKKQTKPSKPTRELTQLEKQSPSLVQSKKQMKPDITKESKQIRTDCTKALKQSSEQSHSLVKSLQQMKTDNTNVLKLIKDTSPSRIQTHSHSFTSKERVAFSNETPCKPNKNTFEKLSENKKASSSHVVSQHGDKFEIRIKRIESIDYSSYIEKQNKSPKKSPELLDHKLSKQSNSATVETTPYESSSNNNKHNVQIDNKGASSFFDKTEKKKKLSTPLSRKTRFVDKTSHIHKSSPPQSNHVKVSDNQQINASENSLPKQTKMDVNSVNTVQKSEPKKRLAKRFLARRTGQPVGSTKSTKLSHQPIIRQDSCDVNSHDEGTPISSPSFIDETEAEVVVDDFKSNFFDIFNKFFEDGKSC